MNLSRYLHFEISANICKYLAYGEMLGKKLVNHCEITTVK